MSYSEEKMEALRWQQLDDSEKQREEQKEKEIKQWVKRNKIVEYAKMVKFGKLYSPPEERCEDAEEKCQEPGMGFAMNSGILVFSRPLSMIKSSMYRGMTFRVPLENRTIHPTTATKRRAFEVQDRPREGGGGATAGEGARGLSTGARGSGEEHPLGGGRPPQQRARQIGRRRECW